MRSSAAPRPRVDCATSAVAFPWKHARLWANGQASSLALTPSHGFRRVQVWPRLCGIT
jgi:hypothetical protein